MIFSLHTFEQHINDTILQRGLNYYQDGLVNEPEKIQADLWEFLVLGSAPYTVKLQLNALDVEDFSCTCPYDGPVCKHIAAALFYMRNHAVDGNHKQKRTQSLSEQVDEILSKLSKSDIESFVRDSVLHENTFRHIFLNRFGYLLEDTSKAFYVRQIKSIVSSVSDKYGFIDYEKVYDLSYPMFQILENAEKMWEAGQQTAAVNATQAVAEEMLQAILNADDSSGTIGSFIDDAIRFLQRIANECKDASVRDSIFRYALEAYHSRHFSDFGWHEDMLQLAASLADQEEKAELIFQLIDRQQDSRYEAEAAARIRLQLIQRMKGEDAMQQFLQENRHFPSIRKQLLEEAYQRKQYQIVKELANEGIVADQEYPGLIMEWYQWLLKVAEAESNTQEVIRVARHLFLQGRYDMQYYDLLKKQVDKEVWKPFLQELLHNIRQKSHWLPIHTLGEIYIKEESWDDLLSLVRQHKSLAVLEKYEPHLLAHFKEEALDMYEEAVSEHFDRASGRSDYQTGCRYLQRMKAAGAHERVNSLMYTLRQMFPRKRALQDELNKMT